MSVPLVIVDDRDPAILYSAGQWSHKGNHAEYQESTTSAIAFDASFNFTFSGRSIMVCGTTARDSINTTISFSIDDGPFQDMITHGGFPLTLYHGTIFRSPVLDPNVQHTLQAKVKTPGKSWYFDYLLYEPTGSKGSPGNEQYYFVDDKDGNEIQYSPSSGSWQQDGEITALINTRTYTSTVGSSFSHTFSGSEVMLYGQLNSTMNTIKASFTLDASPPIISEFGASTWPIYVNVPLFQASNLSSSEEHTIKVEYVEGTDPLHFDYLLVKPKPTSTSSPMFPTVTTTQFGSTEKGIEPGKIAGIVVGALIGLVLLVGVVYLLIRRSVLKRRGVGIGEDDNQLRRHTVRGQSLPPLTPYPLQTSGSGFSPVKSVTSSSGLWKLVSPTSNTASGLSTLPATRIGIRQEGEGCRMVNESRPPMRPPEYSEW